MWINRLYEVPDRLEWIKQFVGRNKLSSVVTHEPINIAHMPIEVLDEVPGIPTLLFHMPRVDPIVEGLVHNGLVTVVIHGPQQYISPGLYQDPGLPTFNYGVAEVTDRARQLEDSELTDHMYRLITQREAMFAAETDRRQWKLDSAAQERFNHLLPALVGFEVSLEHAQVKVKMGQNREVDDVQHTIMELNATPHTDHSVSAMMSRLLEARRPIT